jgi:type IX secretion system PorP/SprF family membrane protein
MKKVIIALLLLVGVAGHTQELNLPVWTQYLADNPFVISPTYAGIGDNFRIRLNGLTQWVGIKDAPNNQSVYADFRIADQSGVGISAYNDKNGNTRQTGAKASFAHHIILDYYSKQYLSFGLSFNINNFKIDIENLDPTNPDPSINNNRFTSNNNFDVGLLYRFNKFYLSLNASNILPKDLDKFIALEPDLLRNYQVYTGYVFTNGGYNRAEFEPSAYFQYFESDRRSSTDINFKYRKYNSNDDYYWLGASYRFLNDQIGKPLNVGPMVGFKKSGFYFGYAYQITLNELAPANSGTHMLTLGFDFFQSLSNCPCTQNPVHD